MTAPYRLSVEQFISHFRGQGELIARVESELHRKILYCAALDPLARAVALPKTTNRAKFVDLLLTHANWADADRVSLFQLTCTLRLKGRSRYRLYREAYRRLNSSPPQRKHPLSLSPTREEMSLFAATREETNALKLTTYAELFYTFRNNLVHEYREPGYGTDWSGRATEPFYTSLSSFGKRELVFPVSFIENIYRECLLRVERYLLSEKLSPHSRFNFGSHWRAT